METLLKDMKSRAGQFFRKSLNIQPLLINIERQHLNTTAFYVAKRTPFPLDFNYAIKHYFLAPRWVIRGGPPAMNKEMTFCEAFRFESRSKHYSDAKMTRNRSAAFLVSSFPLPPFQEAFVRCCSLWTGVKLCSDREAAANSSRGNRHCMAFSIFQNTRFLWKSEAEKISMNLCASEFYKMKLLCILQEFFFFHKFDN